MYNCVIIDDEEIARNVIKQYIERVDILKLSYESEDPVKAYSYLSQNTPDILFLDINMPDLNGIKLLNGLINKPATIFTTAYREYAVEGFELNAVDYLLKPFSFERFLQAVAKVSKGSLDKNEESSFLNTRANDEPYLLVKDSKKTYRFRPGDILYIESYGEYIKIHTASGYAMTLGSLSKMIENLPPGVFIRIHNSFIINQARIDSFTTYSVDIGGNSLPVSRKYRDRFKEELNKGKINFLKKKE